MEERKIIKITQEMRDALNNEEGWCESAIGRIAEALEETLNTLGECIECEENDKAIERTEELMHTLAELYIGLYVNIADSIAERVIKNAVEDILGDPEDTRKGTAIRYAAVGMECMMMAWAAEQKEIKGIDA